MKLPSPAERLALAGAVLLLVLQALPLTHPALEYRQEALWSQPWRLLTGHLVHINWIHTAINAAAWWVVARLFAPDLDAGEQAVALVVAALAIAVGLALRYPSIAWYRGFSGVLHALFFAGASAWVWRTARVSPRTLAELWLPLAVLAGGWIKVALEQPGGAATPYADWLGANTVPQAHLLGAIAGTTFGLWRARRSRARQ